MEVSREKKTQQDAAPEPYDKVVERLEKLVEELEGGKLSLEQSIETFAEGVKLARDAGKKLDESERRVEQLLRAEDGSVEAQPLDEDDEGP